MKYSKWKDIPMHFQAPCNGGIDSGHIAMCFHDLCNNPAALSTVSHRTGDMMDPTASPDALEKWKTLCLWWKSVILFSSNLWLSHYSYWPLPVPFVRRKYKREYMDLRERGYGGMNWTEMYLTWSSGTFFIFFWHDESSGPEGHSWALGCYFVTHMSCSIVRVLQINAFSSSPAVTNRWPSGEKRHVRTPDPLTWKLGRPRRPLCNKMKNSFENRNTNQQGCKKFSKK